MSATNAVEALKFCENILNKILDFQLATQPGEAVFEANTAKNVREIAAASIYGRKKKNYGVIGGSSAGVAGGVMTMVGAALIPFTFGTSMLLMVSGGVIGLAGAGTSIGFSVEKSNADNNSREKLEPTLKMFIDFNKLIANSTVTIKALLEFIRMKIEEKPTSILILDDQLQRMETIRNEAAKLYKDGDSDINIYKKIQLVDACVGNVQKEMIELLKHLTSLDEISDFVNKTKQKCENAFDHLEESIPKPIDENKTDDETNEITFRIFVIKYLAVDVSTPGNKGNDIPFGKAGEAFAKTVAGGGAVAARTVVRAVDVTDNIAKVGGTIAKVAKGISLASVMLSTVGIIIDIAFLGHAIYDLLQVSEIENRQGAKTKNSVKIDPNDFTDLLLDLADIIQRINEIFCWAKTH